MIMEESGDLQAALTNLDEIEGKVVDKISLRETRGLFLLSFSDLTTNRHSRQINRQINAFLTPKLLKSCYSFIEHKTWEFRKGRGRLPKTPVHQP